MKNLIFLFLSLSIFVFSFKTSKSQASLETNVGTYDSKTVEYYKKKLKVYLIEDSVNNQSYLQRIQAFTTLKNGVIDSVYTFLGLTMGAIHFTSQGDDALDLLDDFEQSNLFEHVYPYCVISPEGAGFPTPNDPRFYQQWYLKQTVTGGNFNHDLDAEKAWVITKGDNTNVRIYIVDTGIRCTGNNYVISHQDLTNSYITAGTDWTGNGTINDLYSGAQGHGTKIAGLVAATQDNSLGISGIAPHCRTIIDRVYSINYSEIHFFAQAVYEAYQWQHAQAGRRAVVIISSVGTNFVEPEFQLALNFAQTDNVMVVCAAGNIQQVPSGFVEYPARFATQYSNVISVGATLNSDVITNYSCISRPLPVEELTVVAPGGQGGIATYVQNITSTNFNAYDDYTTNASGTSYACPLAAGTVALMVGLKPNLTGTEIKRRLEWTCERPAGMGDSVYSRVYGYGRVNTFNAVVNCTDSMTGTIGFPFGELTLTDNTVLVHRKMEFSKFDLGRYSYSCSGFNSVFSCLL